MRSSRRADTWWALNLKWRRGFEEHATLFDFFDYIDVIILFLTVFDYHSFIVDCKILGSVKNQNDIEILCVRRELVTYINQKTAYKHVSVSVLWENDKMWHCYDYISCSVWIYFSGLEKSCFVRRFIKVSIARDASRVRLELMRFEVVIVVSIHSGFTITYTALAT